MLGVRRPSAAQIDRLLAEARKADPTYAEVGATREERLPNGYLHDFYERRLGQGGTVWATLPCRVIYVDEDPGRFAFAYGTLPGHPERGEVAFRSIATAVRTRSSFGSFRSRGRSIRSPA